MRCCLQNVQVPVFVDVIESCDPAKAASDPPVLIIPSVVRLQVNDRSALSVGETLDLVPLGRISARPRFPVGCASRDVAVNVDAGFVLDPAVGVSGLAETVIRRPLIGEDHRSGKDELAHFGVQNRAATIRHDLGADASFAFNRREHDRLLFPVGGLRVPAGCCASGRSDSRGFPPTNVSSASTAPDSGASSCVISWFRILLNIRHAVL